MVSSHSCSKAMYSDSFSSELRLSEALTSATYRLANRFSRPDRSLDTAGDAVQFRDQNGLDLLGPLRRIVPPRAEV
jgi:hypothetical protein